MLPFLFKLTLCWGFFALLYRQLLRHETFFMANRLYLLSMMAFSIALAAVPGAQLPATVVDQVMPSNVLPVFTVGMEQVAAVENTWPDVNWLWVLYGMGAALALTRMLLGLYRLMRLRLLATPVEVVDGTRVLAVAQLTAPCSFFNWIFIPLDATNNRVDTASMLAHERAHVRGGHSFDVLLCELLCVVFWFHPLVYWYKRALRTVHEYLADQAASRLINRKQYGLLLIGQSQSGMSIVFANHFFQSPLKQRLVMLTKKTSNPLRAMKFGLVVPAALTFAFLFREAPVLAQKSNAATKPTPVTATETQQAPVAPIPQTAPADPNFKPASKSADAAPEYNGGHNALMQYLAKNLKYPEKAHAEGVQGMVVVKFDVLEDGSITNVQELPTRTNHPDLVAEAIRAVSAMPKWRPAVKDGKITKTEFTLPIKFALELAKPLELSEVSKAPEFTGGQDGMMEFLVKNIQYPADARKEGAEGLVVIKFVVEKDGTLSSFETLRTPRPDLEAEALRVLRLMPPFDPALKEGKPVRTWYTLPIRFKL